MKKRVSMSTFSVLLSNVTISSAMSEDFAKNAKEEARIAD
jgi:hypothetical protein